MFMLYPNAVLSEGAADAMLRHISFSYVIWCHFFISFTPASPPAIPNFLELFLPVQVLVDQSDGNGGGATPHPQSSPASRNRRTNLHPAQSCK